MPESPDQHDLDLLSELADILMVVTRDLRVATLAASGDEKAKLANALNKTGRGVRQTLALKARLGREEKKTATRQRDAAISRKRAQVEGAVKRLIWNEHEGADPEDYDLTETLADLIAEDDERFLTEPLEALVLRVAKDLDLPTKTPLIPAQAETQAEPATAQSDTS